MAIHKTLNQQSLRREIARRSRYEHYSFTEAQADSFLEIFFDIIEEALTKPGGKVSLDRFGTLEVCPKVIGGSLKKGNTEAKATQHLTYIIRYRAAKRLRERLRANLLQSET